MACSSCSTSSIFCYLLSCKRSSPTLDEFPLIAQFSLGLHLMHFLAKMQLQHFLVFNLVVCLLIFQVQAEDSIEIQNKTDIQQGVTKKRRLMLRKLHRNQEQDKGMMRITIHKIQPGDPYYKVFDGDENAARAYTNKIWNRLLNRYSTMQI